LSEGGRFATESPGRHSVVGRTGRRSKPPPQFGHTLSSTFSTQSAQKVHSKVQIRAEVSAGGRSRLQHSQFGLSSSAIAFTSLMEAGRLPCDGWSVMTASSKFEGLCNRVHLPEISVALVLALASITIGVVGQCHSRRISLPSTRNDSTALAGRASCTILEYVVPIGEANSFCLALLNRVFRTCIIYGPGV
jgi:hypothetical protein